MLCVGTPGSIWLDVLVAKELDELTGAKDWEAGVVDDDDLGLVVSIDETPEKVLVVLEDVRNTVSDFETVTKLDDVELCETEDVLLELFGW